MYKCEREMHEHMDAAQRRIDSELEQDETRLGTRDLNKRRAISLAAASVQPDTEVPLESWHEFATGATEAESPLREKASKAVVEFFMGETEYEEFFKPDPLISPSRPQIA